MSSKNSSYGHYTPGMRVEIRDAEWRIKQVNRSSDGGYSLVVEGLSELVQGKERQFLTKLEDNIRILDPAKTQLVTDTSDGYNASLLYIGTVLRQSVPTNNQLHMGHLGALDIMGYQLDPTIQALNQPRQRILIADAVGLGKTLEAGILTSELIHRGRGKRILVLAVKSMLAQFQQEFWNRFTIPLTRLDSTGLQRVRNHIPSNHNPFHYFDRSIISIDTLKQDLEYRHYLEQAYWDIIIIDEAHNVAERSSNSLRSRLAKLLATRSDTLIMLSATPHDGSPESFASLMNMLDPTAIANPSNYAHEDFRDKGLVIRSFKKDIRDQLSDNFPERIIDKLYSDATENEEIVYDRLSEVQFHTLNGKRNNAGQLFRTTLEKALFSSPAACLSTVNNRIDRLNKREPSDDILQDIDHLEGLRLALEAISPEHFSKYQLLLQLLQKGEKSIDWQANKAADRLVIFTESLVTLDFLQKQLAEDLKLKKGQLAVLRGDMADKELMEVVEAFGQEKSKVRLLLCSDVASEGINLHHLSHRMIHFDIPWSLMVFQQRNGRIDRYGQQHQPQIHYLLTKSTQAKVRGDMRILEVLIEKDEQASKNIGDPSEFMGCFSEDEEIAQVADVMEKEVNDNDDISALFAAALDNNLEQSQSPLDNFIDSNKARTTNARISEVTRERTTLYPDVLEYAKASITWLRQQGMDLQAEVDIKSQQLSLTAPKDLQQRYQQLPPEVRPKDHRFILTANKHEIQQELKRCRQEDDPWPKIHYLWPLHPVMDWLRDRALNAFGRHTAPVIRVTKGLQANEQLYFLQGGFPNRKGHPMIQKWVVLETHDGKIQRQLEIREAIDQIELSPGKMQNRHKSDDNKAYQKLLPVVVKEAIKILQQERKEKENVLNEKLNQQMHAMDEHKKQHIQQLEIQFEKSKQAESIKQRRKQEREQEVDRVFEDYHKWLEDTQITEENPYVQVIAVIAGEEA